MSGQGRSTYTATSSLNSLVDVVTKRSEVKPNDSAGKEEPISTYSPGRTGCHGNSNKETAIYTTLGQSSDAFTAATSPRTSTTLQPETPQLSISSGLCTPSLPSLIPSPRREGVSSSPRAASHSTVQQSGTPAAVSPSRQTPEACSPSGKRCRPHAGQPLSLLQGEESRLLSPEPIGQSSPATNCSRQASPFSCQSLSPRGPSQSSPLAQQSGIAPSTAAPDSSQCQPTVTIDRQVLQRINRCFLSLDNSCDNNDCEPDGSSSRHDPFDDQLAPDACLSEQCQVCARDEVSGGSGEDVEICTRRFHRYWHGHCPSPFTVHMTAHNQHLLASVAAALCHFRDRLSQLHRGGGSEDAAPIEEEQMQDTNQAFLETLYKQSASISSNTKDFLLQIPDGSKLAAEDVDSLSHQLGFGSALILLGSQAFDAECQRFRELWSWTVAPTSPLFCFKVQLLALAGKLHAIRMDKMETALLCALSIISTDLPGLKDRTAIREVRASLLDALEAYISSRDQWFKVRVRRLFSVLPDVRVLSAWYRAIISNIRVTAADSP